MQGEDDVSDAHGGGLYPEKSAGPQREPAKGDEGDQLQADVFFRRWEGGMDDPMKRRYICTDTTTGILSAIYDAWKYDRSDQEAGIVFWGNMQQEMFCEYCEVKESEEKARAVRKLIRDIWVRRRIWTSDTPPLWRSGERDCYSWMMMEARSLPDGYRIMGHLSHPAVRTVFEALAGQVAGNPCMERVPAFPGAGGWNSHARITPKNFVLPGIAGHFADRFPLEDYVVYDEPIPRFSFIRDRSSG